MKWLRDFLDWILAFLKSFMLTLWDLLKDAFFLIIDLILGIVGVLLDGAFSILDFNPQQYISALPEEVLNVIGLIGLGEALTIIISAIFVRILLQLVPFTRLGS